MIIAVLFIVSAIFSVNIYAAAPLSDVGNHWAKEQVSYLTEKGIISGYPDNTFKPQNDVTRAEFYRIINGVIGYTELAEINYSDVKKGEWYYDEVAKGVKAGYIFEQQGGKIEPNKAITRQEVARIIGVTFGLTENTKAAEKFVDAGQIADWAKGHVGALQGKKFILGYPDNTFKPQGQITRAEAATMIKNAGGEIVNKGGEHKYEVKGNLLINTSDVVLKDTVIKGDLYLAEGIADGDVTLDHVTVEGETFIRGGGANSIIIKNSKLQNIVANKSVGKVRIVLEGKVNVPQIDIQNNTILVIRDGVTVASIAINGQADIQVQKGAVVKSVEANVAGAIIDSQGTIEIVKATEAIKLNGSDIKKGTETKVADGKVNQPATPPSSGGGGGGGGGGSSTPISANPDTSKIFVRYFDGHIYNYQFKEYAMKKDSKISIYESNSASKSLYSFVVSEDQEGKAGVSFGFTKLYDKALGEQLFISITEPNKRESNRVAVKLLGYPLKDEQTNLEKYDVNVTKDNNRFVITAKGNWNPQTGIGNAYRLHVEIKNADDSEEQFVRTLINGQDTKFEHPANDAQQVKITITELGYQTSDAQVFTFETTEPVVDKSELETAIAQALALEETEYTEASWSALQAALTVAEAVVADDEASQEDVDNAKEALAAAIDGLVKESVSDKEIISIEPVDVISVVYGTPKEAIGLPEQVTLVLDDSSKVKAYVTWDKGTPEYDGNIIEEYAFEGIVTLPENVKNSNNVKAIVKVVVQEVANGDVNVNDISINEGDQELKVGDEFQLTTTITPVNATNQDVVWSTSNEEVAIVSVDGLVTAVAEGEATITVTTVDGDKTDDVIITVVEAEAETDATVSDLAELTTALANADITTINITADISSNVPIKVEREVTINGGNNTLRFTGLKDITGTEDDGLIIYAETTVNNLTVDAGLDGDKGTWFGTYAIHIYNTQATLNNVTAKGGNGGILVNGSDVTLVGNIDVSDNGFGGIEVSIGDDLTDASLDVTEANLTNTSEAYGSPTIWEDGVTDKITANVNQFTTNAEVKTNQVQYYLEADKAKAPDTTDPVLEEVTPASGEIELANDETFVLTVDAFDEGGLRKLEIDHNMEGELPEFSVYASADNPYGSEEARGQFEEQSVVVTYDEDEQKWTIDFGATITEAFVSKGGITFYLVIEDLAGNTFGTMYGTQPENTFAYTVTRTE